MSDRRLVRQLAREWLVTLLALALVIAPFGCQIQSIIDGGSDNTDGDSLDTHTAGMFLNEDTSDPLMVAGRNAAGDAFYVYGTRAVGGAVGEVESILIRTAAGQQALMVFELGRPVYLEGPDGSYARITYNEVSLQRLQATVVVYDAVTQTTETAEAEVDLQKTATEVAALVESVTGRTLELPTAPADTAKLSQRALGPLCRCSWWCRCWRSATYDCDYGPDDDGGIRRGDRRVPGGGRGGILAAVHVRRAMGEVTFGWSPCPAGHLHRAAAAAGHPRHHQVNARWRSDLYTASVRAACE